MRRRHLTLAAAALAISTVASGCGSSTKSATTTTTTQPATTEAPATTGTTEPAVSGHREQLWFGPVLASGPCPPGVTAPSTAPEATTTVPATTAPPTTSGGLANLRSPSAAAVQAAPNADGWYPSTAGGLCFKVGERAGDGNDLKDATVSHVGNEWQVLARPRPESVDKLNALFNGCFNGTAPCVAGEGGHGYAAIVWDNLVTYAPSITAEGLADGPFSLAGGLTERRARDLAALINH